MFILIFLGVVNKVTSLCSLLGPQEHPNQSKITLIVYFSVQVTVLKMCSDFSPFKLWSISADRIQNVDVYWCHKWIKNHLVLDKNIPKCPTQVWPTEPLMAARFLKVSSLATAVLASSGIYVYNRQLDFSDLSVIRFGRAAVAVSHPTIVISQT